MDFDYNFGNDYYKYYGNVGVKSTVYNNQNYKDSNKLKEKVPIK